MEAKLLILTCCLLTGLVLSNATPLSKVEESAPILTLNSWARAETSEYRLPTSSKPFHYTIKLNPLLHESYNFTFVGEIQIDLQVVEETDAITVHSKEQNIDETATVLTNYLNTVQYPITNHTYNVTKDFLTLHTATVLPIGNYSLTLHYSGVLRDDMIGFYKSSYTNSTGSTIWIATSKFEPTHARYAFPCYDEPALKATVDIWLKREAGQHSLANTPIRTETFDSSDGKTWSVFQTTPLISTYLIAFIASDFANISNDDGTFGVWARSSAIGTAQYAYEIGIQSLSSLENFTQVPYNYGLEKMDQIAIPDFASGAMENWGLVTYRERYLLFQEGVSTTADRQNIATVIAHEFAHQWFGNLVSPEWWMYLWLNEGFATYFESFTIHELEPQWRLDEQFPVSEIQASAFVVDGVGTSHPMNADVETFPQIRGIFDSISYAKGGSVIRMMEHIITTPIFKTALNNYLYAHNFDYGTSDRLWEAIQEVVNAGTGPKINVKEVMDTWVTQAGFPVVTVTRDYEAGTALLTQQRFFLKDRSLYDASVRWWVPINWITASEIDYSDTTATTWIPNTETTTINAPSSDEWILLNKQQTGYYRVNYDEANWNLLISHLNGANYARISPVNRAQLIDDALNLARAGYIDYSIALNVTKYLAQETDYIPWYSAFNGFTYVNRLLAQTDAYDHFKDYLTGLLAKVLETVGYEELEADEHVHKFLRTSALTWSCNLGHEACLNFATEKLNSWLLNNDEDAISPNLKSVVYCAGISRANSTVWNLLWEKYLATDLSSEQILILRGLGCASDTEILNNYMRLATTSGSGIRSQDSSTAFTSVYTYGGARNVEPTLNYIIDNLEDIIDYYNGTTEVTTLLSGIGLRTTTTSLLEKLQSFATSQSGLLGSAGNTGISNARENLDWLETNVPAVSTWLEQTLGRSGSSAVIGNMLLVLGVFYLMMRM